MPPRNRHASTQPARVSPARPGRMAWVALICLILLALFPGPSLAASPALVTGLDLAEAAGQQVLTISLAREPETLKTFTLKAPSRLVLDMSPARLAGGKRVLAVRHDLVRAIRAAQFNPSTVRVVFDLADRDTTHRIETRPRATNRDSHQIMVSLFEADAQPVAATSTAADQAVADTPPAAPAPAAEDPSAQQPAAAEKKKIILFGKAEPAPRETAPPSPWGEFDLSGSVMGKVSQEIVEDDAPEQARSWRNTVRVEAKWSPPLAAEERDATTYLLASVQSDYLGFGPDPSSDEYDLDLYEAYASHATPAWDLTLGRQLVRWGKTDQISPVDNLNPQDMREFYLPELEERKMPDWMARLRVFPQGIPALRGASLEAVFIPFFSENEYDDTGTTWALLGVEDTGLRLKHEDPGKGLDQAGYGLRASATVDGWDLSASWLQATQKDPALRLDTFTPHGPTLHAEYARRNIYGFEFETTLDSFGFRGEAAYFDRQGLNTENFDPASSPELHWVLGLDYIGEADWYANIQLSHRHIFEHDPETLFLRRDNVSLNGEVNREFWRGNFMLRLRYAVDLNDGAAYLNPEAILTYFRNLELTLGTSLFFGPQDSFFGRYRDNDQAFLKASYAF